MRRIIKILQFGLNSIYGGTESVVHNQFLALDHAEIQYWFVNEDDERQLAFSEDFIKGGAQIFGLPGRRHNPVRHYFRMLCLLISLRGSVDGVVFNANSYKHVIPLVFSFILHYKLRVFYSHTAGDFRGRGLPICTCLKHKIFATLIRWLSSDLIACSKKAGDWMFGAERPYKIVPNAVNSVLFEDRENFVKSKSEMFTIGMIGNFIYPKNHLFALELFRVFHLRYPKSELLLAGAVLEGRDNQYFNNARRFVDENGLVDSVRFLGHVKDVSTLLKNLDCLIMPSYFEGLPMVGLEAQATGLTCYFSDRITHEVQVNENCTFISIDNGVESWVDAIAHQSTWNRDDLSRLFAKSRFNIKNSIEDLMTLYERRIGNDFNLHGDI